MALEITENAYSVSYLYVPCFLSGCIHIFLLIKQIQRKISMMLIFYFILMSITCFNRRAKTWIQELHFFLKFLSCAIVVRLACNLNRTFTQICLCKLAQIKNTPFEIHSLMRTQSKYHLVLNTHTITSEIYWRSTEEFILQAASYSTVQGWVVP